MRDYFCHCTIILGIIEKLGKLFINGGGYYEGEFKNGLRDGHCKSQDTHALKKCFSHAFFHLYVIQASLLLLKEAAMKESTEMIT